MARHKHADLMKQYAEDASKHEFPYIFWQCKVIDRWHDLTKHPEWDYNTEYRRKPLEQNELISVSVKFMKPLTASDLEFMDPDTTVYYTGFGPRGRFYADSMKIKDVSEKSTLVYHATEWNAIEHVRALNKVYFGEQND